MLLDDDSVSARHRGVVYAVLPVYNEGRSIYTLLHRFVELQKYVDRKLVLCVVDDASTDDSPEWIARACAEIAEPEIRVLRHEKNMGLRGALNSGIAAVAEADSEDIVVTMDGDNTHNPALVPDMLAKIRQGADIVVASRYQDGARTTGLSTGRKLLSHVARVVYTLRWRLPGVRDYTCSFRAFRGSIVSAMVGTFGADPLKADGFACSAEMLRKAASVAEVIVEVPMILRYSDKEMRSNMKIVRTILCTLGMLMSR